MERDLQGQERQTATEARLDHHENLLRDTAATVTNIRTEVDIIDVAASTAAEKATANKTHTKALMEEVDTLAKKLNQYKNGQLSNAMATAVNTLSKAVAEKQIEEWNASAGQHGIDEQNDCKHGNTTSIKATSTAHESR